MPLVPTFDPLSIGDAAQLLQGLAAVDLSQLQRGTPGILAALHRGALSGNRRRLRYIRKDPFERWNTLQGIWRKGGGDCEDLAAAVAAELTFHGIPARPVIYKARPGLYHAVTQVLAPVGRYQQGQILDPSKIGGMLERGGALGNLAAADIGRRAGWA